MKTVKYFEEFPRVEIFPYREVNVVNPEIGFKGDPNFIHTRNGRSAFYFWETEMAFNMRLGSQRPYMDQADAREMRLGYGGQGFSSYSGYMNQIPSSCSFSTNGNDIIDRYEFLDIASRYVCVYLSEEFLFSCLNLPNQRLGDSSRKSTFQRQLLNNASREINGAINSTRNLRQLYTVSNRGVVSPFQLIGNFRLNMPRREPRGCPVLFNNILEASHSINILYDTIRIEIARILNDCYRSEMRF